MPRLASSSGVDFYFFQGSGGSDPEYNGSTMVFAQSAAPTGWTKDTTFNDAALRVVSSTVSNGGSVAFSTVHSTRSVPGSFTAVPVSVGATTLTTTNMEAHTHTYSKYAASSLTMPEGTPPLPPGKTIVFRTGITPAFYTGPTALGSGGAGGSHSHSVSAVPLTLSATANYRIKYMDVILATKDS